MSLQLLYKEKELKTSVQMLDEAVCISLHTDTSEKGM